MISFEPARQIAPDRSRGEGYAADAPRGRQKVMGSGDAAIVGYPELSVPMGFVRSLPVGLSFMGPAWSERRLLGYGYAYEQVTHARIPPTAYKAAK
jgi:Asp-tRNA(Asn)/Glu-tRNA(Gln) amidotransferase A subunit family amidase